MATAVQVYQLPPARPRGAPPSGAPARPVLWQQPGFLQRRLDVRVGQRDPVLTARDLVEVPRVEARVLLAIKLHEALDFGERRPAAARADRADGRAGQSSHHAQSAPASAVNCAAYSR